MKWGVKHFQRGISKSWESCDKSWENRAWLSQGAAKNARPTFRQKTGVYWPFMSFFAALKCRKPAFKARKCNHLPIHNSRFRFLNVGMCGPYQAYILESGFENFEWFFKIFQDTYVNLNFGTVKHISTISCSKTSNPFNIFSRSEMCCIRIEFLTNTAVSYTRLTLPTIYSV